MFKKIKDFLSSFFKKTGKAFSAFGIKIKNGFIKAGGGIKKAFISLGRAIKTAWSKSVVYIKEKVGIKRFILLVSVFVLCIAISVGIILHSVYSSETADKDGGEIIELSINYDGNLINIYSDKLNLFPYGNLAFSSDGANKKSMELKDGYLEMSEAFDLGREFTFQTWVKIKDTGIVNPIILGRASSGGDLHNGPVTIKFYNEYKTILCDMTFIDAKGEYVSHSFLADNFIDTETLVNIWHHVAVTFGEEGYTLYFDSKPVKTVPLPENLVNFKAIASNKNPFFIGIGENGNMKAQIDETRFFSYSLSSDKIKEEYEKAHPARVHQVALKNDSNSATVNGEVNALDGKVLKDKTSNTYLVPLKSTIECIGGSFSTDEAEPERYNLSYKNKNISVWLMDTNAISGESHIKLDFYPQIFDEVVYVPVEMFSKVFNLDVNTNEENIVINY